MFFRPFTLCMIMTFWSRTQLVETRKHLCIVSFSPLEFIWLKPLKWFFTNNIPSSPFITFLQWLVYFQPGKLKWFRGLPWFSLFRKSTPSSTKPGSFTLSLMLTGTPSRTSSTPTSTSSPSSWESSLLPGFMDRASSSSSGIQMFFSQRAYFAPLLSISGIWHASKLWLWRTLWGRRKQCKAFYNETWYSESVIS